MCVCLFFGILCFGDSPELKYFTVYGRNRSITSVFHPSSSVTFKTDKQEEMVGYTDCHSLCTIHVSFIPSLPPSFFLIQDTESGASTIHLHPLMCLSDPVPSTPVTLGRNLTRVFPDLFLNNVQGNPSYLLYPP